MKILKGQKNKLTDEQRVAIGKEYLEGLSIRALASKYSINSSTASKVIKKNGIEIRGHAGVSPVVHVDGLPFRECYGCKKVLSLNNFKKRMSSGKNIGGDYCADCRKIQYALTKDDSVAYNREYIKNRKRDDWAGYKFI